MTDDLIFQPPDITGTTLGAYRALDLLESGPDWKRYSGVGRISRIPVQILILPPYAPQPLDHPYIAPYYASGITADAYQFRILPTMSDVSLSERLRETSAAQIARIIGGLAGALEYAHKLGRTHGAVSMDNVGIDRYGNPYWLDFDLITDASQRDDVNGLCEMLMAATEWAMPGEDAIRLESLATETFHSAAEIRDKLRGTFAPAPTYEPAHPAAELRPLWPLESEIFQHSDQPITTCRWVSGGFLSAGEDGRVYRWAGGKKLELAHTDSAIISLTVPAGGDGSRFATAHRDGAVRLWGLGGFLQEIWLEDVRDCALSGDGLLLAIVCGDGSLRLWDSLSEGIVQTIRHSAPLTCCSLSDSGQLVVAGDSEGRLFLWNTRRGERLQTFEGHQAPISACQLRGELVFSGTTSGELAIWDILMQDPPHFWQGHAATVTACALNEINGQVMGLSAGYDESAAVWDVRANSLLETLPINGLRSADLGSGGSLIGMRDGTLQIFPLAITRQSGRLRALRITPNLLFVADESCQVRQIRTSSGETLETLTLDSPPHSLEITSHYLLTGNEDGLVHCFSRETGRLRWEASAHHGAVATLFMLNDGALVSGGTDGRLALWNPVTGARLGLVEIGSAAIRCGVAWDGQALIGTQEGDIAAWDILAGTKRWALATLGGPVTACSTANGWLAVGAADGTVTLWQGRSPSDHFQAHHNAISTLALTASGKHLLTGDVTGVMRLWSVKEARLLYDWSEENSSTVSGWIDDYRMVWGDTRGRLNGGIKDYGL